MAFKMNTSIGKIYAKTQGTKPHAKAIATAKAPTPAKGNVHSVNNPLNYSSPLNETEAQRLAKKIAEYKKNEGIKALEAESNKTTKKQDPKKGGKDPYKKAEGKDKNLSSYVKKQKSLKKGTPEWNANQNKINEAYGVKKRYGKGDSTTSTTATGSTTNVKSQADKDKETKRQKDIMSTRVTMGGDKSKDTKSTDTKAGSDLVGKSRKETRLDRRLAKTQSKGRAIADGKGTKTPAEQRKALRLKRREGRLKKRIENKTKKGPKKGIPITEQGKLNRVEKKSSKKEIPKTTPDFVKYKPTGIKPEGLKLDSTKDFLKKSRTKPS